MSVVTLVSGGLDSALMAVLARESGVEQFPLFVDYGQQSRSRELRSCRALMKHFDLPAPEVVTVSGFGRLIRSGLTDRKLRVFEDAFTPNRNLLFLLLGSAYAFTLGANAVAIGLLSERTCIFPDQTDEFLRSAESTLLTALGRKVRILAPLREFTKKDVVRLCKKKRISGAYSCHRGTAIPCGRCVACREYLTMET